MALSRRLFLISASAASVAACTQTIPPEALQLSPTALQDRQMQTRRFGTKDEPRLMKAGAQVLQDLGFNIEESETRLGVIVANKDRDARETGQIVGAVFMAVLFGANAARYDTEQKIRASMVSLPVDGGADTAVRVTFQRLVWNNRKELSKIEGINDAKIYQEFFEKLSQSVFLTAQEI